MERDLRVRYELEVATGASSFDGKSEASQNKLRNVENECIFYVAESEAKTESTAAQSAKSAALYREEIFARDTRINFATAKIQGLEAEMQQASLVIQQQTVSSEITVQHLHFATEAIENMRLAHVEGLQLAQTCSAEFAEAHSNYENECAMYLKSYVL